MDISSWVSFILVILGAVIMGINIIKYFKTYRNFKLIPNTSRKFLNIECKVHLLLMCFFLLGYLSVAIGIIFNQLVVGLTFVGIIFFFWSYICIYRNTYSI